MSWVFLYHFAINVFCIWPLSSPAHSKYNIPIITFHLCVFCIAYLQGETKRKASSTNPTKVARVERIQ